MLTKCCFELTYFYDLLTYMYLKTITAKLVIFSNKLKLMMCMFELTYFYDLLTYLKTIRAKVVMFCIKPKLIKCRLEVTHFHDLLTYLKTVRGMPTSSKDDTLQIIPGFLILPTFQGHRCQSSSGSGCQ
jgi:hypothetical protein